MRIEINLYELPYTAETGENVRSGIIRPAAIPLEIDAEAVTNQDGESITNPIVIGQEWETVSVLFTELDMNTADSQEGIDTQQDEGFADRGPSEAAITGAEEIWRLSAASAIVTCIDANGEESSFTAEKIYAAFTGNIEVKEEKQTDKTLQREVEGVSENEQYQEEGPAICLTISRSDEGMVIAADDSQQILLHATMDDHSGDVLQIVNRVIISGSVNYGDNWAQDSLSICLRDNQCLEIKGGSYSKKDEGVLSVSGSEKSPILLDIKTVDNSMPHYEDIYEQTVVLECPDYAITSESIPLYAFIVTGILLLLAVIETFLLFRQKKRGRERKNSMQNYEATEPYDKSEVKRLMSISQSGDQFQSQGIAPTVLAGKLHNIGRRSSQQDSLGLTQLHNSIFAVVADGMGGLANGDKVSQQIVYTMLSDAETNRAGRISGNLIQMVAHANNDVNQLLGQNDQYVSGSTLVAVLAEPQQFQWISVGDSRIYLYRGGSLLQLNREHVYEAELLTRAANGEFSFQEARGHAKRKSVSSFIGMGELKYIDEALRPTPALRGDRILLTSDGVFNTLTDEEIASILSAYPDPSKAAQELETAVLKKENPYQDNFSAILIAYQ